MKKPILILLLLYAYNCLAQEQDTLKQGVIKVRKVPEKEMVLDSLPERDWVRCGYFQPFYKAYTFSAGYQKWDFGFAEIGFWSLRQDFPSIMGLIAESDFKNTHALLFSAAHGLIRKQRFSEKTGEAYQLDIIRFAINAGGVRDQQRLDVLFRPELQWQLPWSLSYFQVSAGYNFRFKESSLNQTNKVFVSGRFYIP